MIKSAHYAVTYDSHIPYKLKFDNGLEVNLWPMVDETCTNMGLKASSISIETDFSPKPPWANRK